MTFDHTAAVIRLAHKYSLPAVRDEALRLLQQFDFPSSAPRARLVSSPNPLVRVEPIHAIGAVNLARLVDEPALLYPALYRCAVLGSAVLAGWARDDGEVERLEPEDLRLCMDARAALARVEVAIFAAMFVDTLNEDCESIKECRAGLRRLEDVLLLEEFGKRHDVLDRDGVGGDVKERAKALGVCKGCRMMLEHRRDEKQREIWRRLPKLFGMEGKGWISDSDEESMDEDENDDAGAN